jgi:hypothetical protein
LLLIHEIVALQINDLFGYAIVAISTAMLFDGTLTTRAYAWRVAVGLAAVIVAAQVLLAPPKIEEGHNVFLADGAKRPLEAVLPGDVFRFMQSLFDARFPPQRRCDPRTAGCWRGGQFPTAAYAFSADGVFQKPEFSRRVDDIGFGDPVWLRLGFVNDLGYNWYSASA